MERDGRTIGSTRPDMCQLRRCFQPRQWFQEACNQLDEELRKEDIMWVYRPTEDDRWMVGFWSPDREWFADSFHATPESAAARVRWLNGGQLE